MSIGLINKTLKKLSEKLSNTGWVSLSSDPNKVLQYRKKNGFVIVNGASTNTMISTGGTYVGQLPVGARPDIAYDNPCSALGGTSEILVRIMTNGQILLLAQPATQYWSFTFIFPISGGVHRLFAVTPLREGAVA